MKNYIDEIVSILHSVDFRERLQTLSANYPNLKLEGVIRNFILEKLNDNFFNASSQIRAFAEHPRIKGTRVDLSIVNEDATDNPFKIEFKFQFSGDDNCMKNYGKVINRDFEFRQSDLFFLIVAHWKKEEKQEFDKKWGITSKLSRYISKTDEWKVNLKEAFKDFSSGELLEFEKISIEKPYAIDYYFYLLNRKTQ